jgi:chemotaxis protein CheX
MMENHRELLTKVFSEVIEALAFMFADETDADELPASPDGYLEATMSFKGDFSGRLALAVSKDMCPELAGNILGVEPDDERVMEKAEDALKELLNMVCGHVLTSLAGEEPVFDLTVPAMKNLGAAEWAEMTGRDDVATLLVDDYPVALLLSLSTEGS